MKKLLTILALCVGVLAVAGYASADTSEALQPAGNTSVNAQQGIFDTVRIGNVESGGVTYFNGSIVNEGAAVTIADDLRVDGVIYRGVEKDSDTPIKIYDDVQISGNLTAGSITGLSGMVSAAGFAKITALAPYAKASDLSSYATTTRVNILSSEIDDLSDDVDLNYAIAGVLYEYNRCTLYLGEYDTNPYISDMTFCWNLWVGTSTGLSSDLTKELNADKVGLSNSDKLKMEKDRVR